MVKNNLCNNLFAADINQMINNTLVSNKKPGNIRHETKTR